MSGVESYPYPGPHEAWAWAILGVVQPLKSSGSQRCAALHSNKMNNNNSLTTPPSRWTICPCNTTFCQNSSATLVLGCSKVGCVIDWLKFYVPTDTK